MSAACHHHDHHHGHGHDHDHGEGSPRVALWIALLLNGGMFAVEVVAGLTSGSTALLADSADFLGDAANYALALAVLSLALVWRARAALLKGAMKIGRASCRESVVSVRVDLGGRRIIKKKKKKKKT